MTKNIKKSSLIKITNNSLVNLPTPTSISYLWNWGSTLGVTLMIQILSGILLASHYNSNLTETFKTMINITRNINWGYELRFIHMNTASIFFICLFIHISRGLFMSSFKLTNVWMVGVVILFVLMGTAFLGYVLPWGQMSLWGATVITNLLSAIPMVGNMLVEWLWGGFSISKATLSRFFTLHFLMPFILSAAVIIHLMELHQKGSNNPMGVKQSMDNLNFHPFFSLKDSPTITSLFLFSILLSLFWPFILGDPENFNLANPLNTPIHIQPEWYFLFAYAILRSIPNKLGGVMALVMSILYLIFLPFYKKMKSSKKWSPNSKLWFWAFCSTFSLLSWAGAMSVEYPFETISKMLSVFYFASMLNICF